MFDEVRRISHRTAFSTECTAVPVRQGMIETPNFLPRQPSHFSAQHCRVGTKCRSNLVSSRNLPKTAGFSNVRRSYKQLGSHAEASFARVAERQHHRRRYTSFTFLSGRLRIGLPVAAKTALSTAGATTQIVGSPTPPQKS